MTIRVRMNWLPWGPAWYAEELPDEPTTRLEAPETPDTEQDAEAADSTKEQGSFVENVYPDEWDEDAIALAWQNLGSTENYGSHPFRKPLSASTPSRSTNTQ